MIGYTFTNVVKAVRYRLAAVRELNRIRILKRAGYPGWDAREQQLLTIIYGPGWQESLATGTSSHPQSEGFDSTTPTKPQPTSSQSNVLITINGGTGNAGLAGPGTFKIQGQLASFTEILEITCQPSAATQLQIVEGLGKIPISAPYTCAANQVWSAPTKIVTDDVYLIVGSTSIVQVETRARPLV